MTLPPLQNGVGTGTLIIGSAVTVIVEFTDREQPLALVTEYETVVVPADIPVTWPVLLIVATEGLLLNQDPLGVEFERLIDEPAHTEVAPVIAATAGSGLTVIAIVENTLGQGPVGSFVVSLSVTVPLVIEGVYDEVSEFALEKVPLGADHVALVAPPPTTPARLIDPPAQTVCGDPAFTVATGFTVMSTVETAAPQGPAGSFVVNVSVTVPLAIVGV